MSRTPIREVLRRLESEGLIASHPYKGFIVNTKDVDDLYTIRINSFIKSLKAICSQFKIDPLEEKSRMHFLPFFVKLHTII